MATKVASANERVNRPSFFKMDLHCVYTSKVDSRLTPFVCVSCHLASFGTCVGAIGLLAA
jgi:hypothetical protein